MKSDEPWKIIFNLKCLWLVLARFDYMGLVDGAEEGDLDELEKG
jgi:hypothetical protein